MGIKDNSAYHNGAVEAFEREAEAIESKSRSMSTRAKQYGQLLEEYKSALAALTKQWTDIEKHVMDMSIDADDTPYQVLAKVRERFKSFGKED